MVGTSDKKQTILELLQEDNTLSIMPATQNNEHCARTIHTRTRHQQVRHPLLQELSRELSFFPIEQYLTSSLYLSDEDDLRRSHDKVDNRHLLFLSPYEFKQTGHK